MRVFSFENPCTSPPQDEVGATAREECSLQYIIGTLMNPVGLRFCFQGPTRSYEIGFGAVLRLIDISVIVRSHHRLYMNSL